MRLPAAHGSLASTSGNRVVLPAPGGATTTAAVPRARVAVRSGVTASMGRGVDIMGNIFGSLTRNAVVSPITDNRASFLSSPPTLIPS
jgi:hypothetical protein